MTNPELWKRLDEIADLGYNPDRNEDKERFNREEIEKMCEDFDLSTEGNCGRVRERLAEECGFNFEQGYSTTPRSFRQSEVKKIIKTYEERGMIE
jgi:hypothetical protein